MSKTRQGQEELGIRKQWEATERDGSGKLSHLFCF